MSKSVMQVNRRCYLCGKTVGLEKHHILGGPNRKWSEKFGLWVWLDAECHRGTEGAQYGKDLNLRLKREAQLAFEADYGHDKWMEIFKKNYI